MGQAHFLRVRRICEEWANPDGAAVETGDVGRPRALPTPGSAQNSPPLRNPRTFPENGPAPFLGDNPRT